MRSSANFANVNNNGNANNNNASNANGIRPDSLTAQNGDSSSKVKEALSLREIDKYSTQRFAVTTAGLLCVTFLWTQTQKTIHLQMRIA